MSTDKGQPPAHQAEERGEGKEGRRKKSLTESLNGQSPQLLMYLSCLALTSLLMDRSPESLGFHSFSSSFPHPSLSFFFHSFSPSLIIIIIIRSFGCATAGPIARHPFSQLDNNSNYSTATAAIPGLFIPFQQPTQRLSFSRA